MLEQLLEEINFQRTKELRQMLKDGLYSLLGKAVRHVCRVRGMMMCVCMCTRTVRMKLYTESERRVCLTNYKKGVAFSKGLMRNLKSLSLEEEYFEERKLFSFLPFFLDFLLFSDFNIFYILEKVFA